jgi:starch synthase
LTSPHRQTFPRRILFATPECAPLAKTGGLGDVSAALPEALAAAGADVRVIMPGYWGVLDHDRDARPVAQLTVLGQPVRLLESKLPSGVPLLIVDSPSLYKRGGGPYQADDGDDWEDNALRFGVLSKVAAILSTPASPIAWRPQVLHCNDWPTALGPVYLRYEEGTRAATVFTIHNLAFQGNFDMERMQGLSLPPQALETDGLEFYGRASLLKGALVCADAITTVSPTYAREIQSPELGFGMDGVLRARADNLHGVLNGIDTALWNPQEDALIASRYGPLTLERKLPNKLALKERLALKGRGDVALAVMVSRLTHQKGVDLLAAAIDAMVAMGVQVAVLGTGERAMVDALKAAAQRHPGHVGLHIGFDEGLAHLLEAGGDFFLMPSRFEPCGMNQMYSQRYGTPPLATTTGGLVDTIVDEDDVPSGSDLRATGFLMREASTPALLHAVTRALAAYRDPRRWRALQVNGMARDFGWARAARRYLDIYSKVVPGTDFGVRATS